MQRSFTRSYFLAVVLFISVAAQSQYYYYNNSYYDKDVIWELGTSVGIMNAVTDVGSKKGFFPNFKSSQVNASIYVGALYQNIAGARLELTYGRIAGADSLGANAIRNLSFRTPIREIALIGEFHPLALKYSDEPSKLSPYVAAGLGWIAFNPQANLNGNWIDLQPLRTEGQGFPETKPYTGDTRPYRLAVSTWIYGAGVRFDASHLINFRAELLYRNTYTDYLDDASGMYVDRSWFDNNLSTMNATLAKQLFDRTPEKNINYKNNPGEFTRGNRKTRDGYFTFNLKMAINLGRQRTDL